MSKFYTNEKMEVNPKYNLYIIKINLDNLNKLLWVKPALEKIIIPNYFLEKAIRTSSTEFLSLLHLGFRQKVMVGGDKKLCGERRWERSGAIRPPSPSVTS